jgi:hypothetical protein
MSDTVQSEDQRLEIAAIEYAGGYSKKTHDAYLGFVNGAKWQSNRIKEQADKILNYENVMHEQDLKIAGLEAELQQCKEEHAAWMKCPLQLKITELEAEVATFRGFLQEIVDDRDVYYGTSYSLVKKVKAALQSPSAKDTPDIEREAEERSNPVEGSDCRRDDHAHDCRCSNVAYKQNEK